MHRQAFGREDQAMRALVGAYGPENSTRRCGLAWSDKDCEHFCKQLDKY